MKNLQPMAIWVQWDSNGGDSPEDEQQSWLVVDDQSALVAVESSPPCIEVGW